MRDKFVPSHISLYILILNFTFTLTFLFSLLSGALYKTDPVQEKLDMLFFCWINFVFQIKSLFSIFVVFSHPWLYLSTQCSKWVSWFWMEKHILWNIKHWFSIAFVKLTILEVWMKYWFPSKDEKLITLGTTSIIILK